MLHTRVVVVGLPYQKLISGISCYGVSVPYMLGKGVNQTNILSTRREEWTELGA